MKKTKLTPETIQKYKSYLIEEERSAATIVKYMRDIQFFYKYLPKDKLITKEMVISFKQSLNDKYKATSINSMLVAINGLLTYMRLDECKVKLQKIQKKIFQDETNNLTQNEYRRLLAAAESKHNQKLLILMQTICATGIRVSEHKYITVEAVKKGSTTIYNKGKIREILFPKELRTAL